MAPVTAMTTLRPIDDRRNACASTIRFAIICTTGERSRECSRAGALLGQMMRKMRSLRAAVLLALAPWGAARCGGCGRSGRRRHPGVSRGSPPQPRERRRASRAVHLHGDVHREPARWRRLREEVARRDLRGVPIGRAPQALPAARLPRRPAGLREGARGAGQEARGEAGAARGRGGRPGARPSAPAARRRNVARSRRSSTRSSGWTTSA